MKSRFPVFGLALWILLVLPAVASAGSYPVEGYLTDADGHPLTTSSAVTLRFQVVGTSGCIAYEESHQLLNLFGSGGYFNVPFGQGNRVATAAKKDTNTIEQAMNQGTTTFTGSDSGGADCTYNPQGADFREMKVSYSENGVTETLAETIKIASVPYANSANLLQGKAASDFILAPSASTQADFDYVFDDGPYAAELKALADKSSTTYMKTNPGAPVGFNNQVIQGVAAPSAGTDATNKDYVDGKIGGVDLDLTGASNGQVLKYDGSKWIADTVSSTSLTNGGDAGPVTAGTTDNNALTLVSNGNAALTIDTAQGVAMTQGLNVNGSIGVGTVAPASKLDVSGRITSGPIDGTAGNTGSIKFLDSDASNFSGIRSADVTTADYWLTLPSSLGTTGQLLSTDASGQLSWVSAGGAGDFKADGSVAMTNTLNMGTQKIENMVDPTTAQEAATKNYVDTQVGTASSDAATRLPLAGGTMTGILDMGTQKIQNVVDPTAAQEAATKNYVDTQVSTASADAATRLPLAGGTMTGILDMGTQKIQNVVDPTAAQEAATKNYVDTQVSTASADAATRLPLAGGTMTGILDMGTQKIQNVVDPTAAQEAATKNYVDTEITNSISVAMAATVNLSGNPGVVSLGTSNSNDLIFLTNNTERLRVDAAGFLGIGVVNPTRELHLNGVMRLQPMADPGIGGSQPGDIFFDSSENGLAWRDSTNTTDWVYALKSYNGNNSEMVVDGNNNGTGAFNLRLKPQTFVTDPILKVEEPSDWTTNGGGFIESKREHVNAGGLAAYEYAGLIHNEYKVISGAAVTDSDVSTVTNFLEYTNSNVMGNVQAAYNRARVSGSNDGATAVLGSKNQGIYESIFNGSGDIYGSANMAEVSAGGTSGNVVGSTNSVTVDSSVNTAASVSGTNNIVKYMDSNASISSISGSFSKVYVGANIGANEVSNAFAYDSEIHSSDAGAPNAISQGINYNARVSGDDASGIDNWYGLKVLAPVIGMPLGQAWGIHLGDKANANFGGAVVGNHDIAPISPTSGTTFDFKYKNTIYTDDPCATFNLNGLRNGGNYSLIVRDGVGSGGTCSFNAYDPASGALAVKAAAGHGPKAANSSVHRIYSFMVVGGVVYVTWVDFNAGI